MRGQGNSSIIFLELTFFCLPKVNKTAVSKDFNICKSGPSLHQKKWLRWRKGCIYPSGVNATLVQISLFNSLLLSLDLKLRAVHAQGILGEFLALWARVPSAVLSFLNQRNLNYWKHFFFLRRTFWKFRLWKKISMFYSVTLWYMKVKVYKK